MKASSHQGWSTIPLGRICRPTQWTTIPGHELLPAGFPVFGANGRIGFYHSYNHAEAVVAVTCRGATCGEIHLVPPKSYVTGNAMCLDDLDETQASPRYLYHTLKLQGVREIISGSAQPQIIGFDLRKISILLPPLPEQHKIADILGTWNEALEKLDALLAAKERRKSGLMQQLLTGKRRLPGFKGKWVSVRLGELFSERNESGRPDLPLLSITGDRGIVRRDGLVKRDTSSEDKSRYLRIASGDIGYNTMRMWQGVSALSSLEGIVSPAYTICVPGKRMDGRFAAHFFKLPHTISLFHRYSQGLVDDTLNLKFPTFSVIVVAVPSGVAEQSAIAQILDAADTELRLLGQKRAALDQQKRGLMQQLLTGKRRVKP